MAARICGNSSGGFFSGILNRTKTVNHCAGQLSQAGSVSNLSGGRVPEVLGSNTFGDIATLATGRRVARTNLPILVEEIVENALSLPSPITKTRRVPLDKSEGVVKRHFFSAMLSSTAWISERVEDRSSETLTVNQLSAARSHGIVPPTIDTA